MKIFLLSLGIALSSQVFAFSTLSGQRNAYEELKLGQGEQNAYEILAELYRSHHLPARKSDFVDTEWNCVSATVKNPFVLFDTAFGLKNIVVTPDQGARGPLFPAKPGVHQTILVPLPKRINDQMLGFFSNVETPNDLKIVLKKNNLVSIVIGEVGSFSFRRSDSGDLLSYFVESKTGTPEQYPISAGYCYK